MEHARLDRRRASPATPPARAGCGRRRRPTTGTPEPGRDRAVLRQRAAGRGHRGRRRRRARGVDPGLGARASTCRSTVSEVRPDGQETFVQSGWLRTSVRKLDDEDEHAARAGARACARRRRAAAEGQVDAGDRAALLPGPRLPDGLAVRVTVSAPAAISPSGRSASVVPDGHCAGAASRATPSIAVAARAAGRRRASRCRRRCRPAPGCAARRAATTAAGQHRALTFVHVPASGVEAGAGRAEAQPVRRRSGPPRHGQRRAGAPLPADRQRGRPARSRRPRR